jgi:hypothetical protein
MTSKETHTLRKYTVAITDSPQYTHTSARDIKKKLLDLKDYPSLMKFTVHLFMAILDQTTQKCKMALL